MHLIIESKIQFSFKCLDIVLVAFISDFVYGSWEGERAVLNCLKIINVEQRDLKTTSCKAYFKQILAFIGETWTFVKNKKKVQMVNMTCFRSIKRRTRRDRIKN